jgi:hypothetical protein
MSCRPTSFRSRAALRLAPMARCFSRPASVQAVKATTPFWRSIPRLGAYPLQWKRQRKKTSKWGAASTITVAKALPVTA